MKYIMEFNSVEHNRIPIGINERLEIVHQDELTPMHHKPLGINDSTGRAEYKGIVTPTGIQVHHAGYMNDAGDFVPSPGPSLATTHYVPLFKQDGEIHYKGIYYEDFTHKGVFHPPDGAYNYNLLLGVDAYNRPIYDHQEDAYGYQFTGVDGDNHLVVKQGDNLVPKDRYNASIRGPFFEPGEDTLPVNSGQIKFLNHSQKYGEYGDVYAGVITGDYKVPLLVNLDYATYEPGATLSIAPEPFFFSRGLYRLYRYGWGRGGKKQLLGIDVHDIPIFKGDMVGQYEAVGFNASSRIVFKGTETQIRDHPFLGYKQDGEEIYRGLRINVSGTVFPLEMLNVETSRARTLNYGDLDPGGSGQRVLGIDANGEYIFAGSRQPFRGGVGEVVGVNKDFRLVFEEMTQGRNPLHPKFAEALRIEGKVIPIYKDVLNFDLGNYFLPVAEDNDAVYGLGGYVGNHGGHKITVGARTVHVAGGADEFVPIFKGDMDVYHNEIVGFGGGDSSVFVKAPYHDPVSVDINKLVMVRDPTVVIPDTLDPFESKIYAVGIDLNGEKYYAGVLNSKNRLILGYLDVKDSGSSKYVTQIVQQNDIVDGKLILGIDSNNNAIYKGIPHKEHLPVGVDIHHNIILKGSDLQTVTHPFLGYSPTTQEPIYLDLYDSTNRMVVGFDPDPRTGGPLYRGLRIDDGFDLLEYQYPMIGTGFPPENPIYRQNRWHISEGVGVDKDGTMVLERYAGGLGHDLLGQDPKTGERYYKGLYTSDSRMPIGKRPATPDLPEKIYFENEWDGFGYVIDIKANGTPLYRGNAVVVTTRNPVTGLDVDTTWHVIGRANGDRINLVDKDTYNARHITLSADGGPVDFGTLGVHDIQQTLPGSGGAGAPRLALTSPSGSVEILNEPTFR